MASKLRFIHNIINMTMVVFITATSFCYALDTDIYGVSPNPNVAILFDTSGSMRFGLYNNQIDYKQIYIDACTIDSSTYTAYDRDNTDPDAENVGGKHNKYYKALTKPELGSPLYDLELDEIVLIKGNTGLYIKEITTPVGIKIIATTGDPGDPETRWIFDDLRSTGTTLTKLLDNTYGNDSRLSLDSNDKDDEIFLDGKSLELGQTINLHNIVKLEGFAQSDMGFAGAIKSLGYYFSGYESVAENILVTAEEKGASESPETVYFLASANWVYMMLAYQLYTENYDENNPSTLDDSVLQTKSFTTGNIWQASTLSSPITSPNYNNDYPLNESGTTPIGTISNTIAKKIKLHFTEITLADNNDVISIADATTGNILVPAITSYTDLDSEGWSAEITLNAAGNGLDVYFSSDDSGVAKGFKIDKYEYLSLSGEYKLQTRLIAIQDAIGGVIESPLIKGKVNWALANYSGNDGADVWQPLNPAGANDDANRNSLEKHIEMIQKKDSYGESPLGESLQDIFKHFVDKGKNNKLGACSQQFCILISDGFPSEDEDWNRMVSVGGEAVTDFDSDGWKSDPSRGTPVNNYSDDVASYMYSHTFKNNIGAGVGDDIDENERQGSFHNIKTHTLSFAQSVPQLDEDNKYPRSLLEDIAADGGGQYLTANDREQLIQSLLYLALSAIKSTSYVAPVISVDTTNKTQSGEWLYMAFFKPNQTSRWAGNLKKYRLVLKPKASCENRPLKEWVVCDQKTTVANDGTVNGNDAVDCEGVFYPSSKSYWSTEEDGGEVTKGGVGSLLKDRVINNFSAAPYRRAIYVLKNDGSTESFVPTNTAISNSNLGLGSTAEDDVERYEIFNYMYGYTYAVDSTNSKDPVACRSWQLGSFIHSNPTIITYENTNKSYIVIGSNDGMLHIFDDDDGQEVIAFIPEDFLGSLTNLNTDPDGDGFDNCFDGPLFFIDGQTTHYYTIDQTNGNIEPKQFIFGLRRGGKHYYSLNVEDPDPTNWKLKWHIGASGDFDQMGQTWSKMEIMKLDADTTVGVFSGGYDEAEDDDANNNIEAGTALYVIDILTSDTSGITLIKKIDHSTNSEMTHSIPADPSLIPNLNGYLSGIYFADVDAQIWHIGNNGDNFDDDPRLVFISNSSSSGRKMFYSPTVTLLGNCDYKDDQNPPQARDPGTYVLVVGTGDRANPKRTDVNNRIYMIVDSNENSSLTESDLYDVTDDELDIDSDYTGNKKDLREVMATKNGWYINLSGIGDEDILGGSHVGEKILAQPTIFYNVAYIPSFTPDTNEDECNPKGLARIYALHYCDGTAGLNYYLGEGETRGDNPIKKYDYLDRYRTIGKSMPSTPKIIIREGVVAAFSSVGGGVPGLGEEGTSKIPQPKFGIDMINWRTIKGQSQ